MYFYDGIHFRDISNNPLACDCELLWLLDWTTKPQRKLLSNPKCNHPFKGKSIRKLKIGVDVHCRSFGGSREIPSVDLSPRNGQVIFEGDSLKLHCTALIITNFQEAHVSDNVTWTWQQSSDTFNKDVAIDNRFLNDQGIISSTLSIRTVRLNHTGNWSCHLLTTQGNHSKDISVVVISEKSKYCPIAITNNNKGRYVWPQTIVNNTVTLTCESLQVNKEISLQKATYTCSESAVWTNFDTSKCGYISETTKILEQFSKVNLTLTKSTILESAKHFKNYTSNLTIIKDIMDLIFIIRTIENYINYLEFEKELGAILLDITDNLLNLPNNFLDQIDTSQLARIITRVASYTQPHLLHKENVALEEFSIQEETFNGMTCTWFIDAVNVRDRIFQCTSANQSTLMGIQNRVIDASIQIPFNIFYNINDVHVTLKKITHSLIVIMYSNSKFFPVKVKNKEIVSSVIGIQLGKQHSLRLYNDFIFNIFFSSRLSVN